MYPELLLSVTGPIHSPPNHSHHENIPVVVTLSSQPYVSARCKSQSDVLMVSKTRLCIGLQILSTTTGSIQTLSLSSLSDIDICTTSHGKHSDAPNTPVAKYSVLILFAFIISTRKLVMYQRWLLLTSNNRNFVQLYLSSPFVAMTVAICITTILFLDTAVFASDTSP